MKLREREQTALRILLEAGRELRGMEIVEASHGVISRADIYWVLFILEQRALVEQRFPSTDEESPKAPRPFYKATTLARNLSMVTT
jgi:hypothetical protein